MNTKVKQGHTPGPWNTNGVLIMNNNGSVVAKSGQIAGYEANATLIAACPEMLEALKFIRLDSGFGHLSVTAQAMLNDAIAKATNERGAS